MLRQASREIIQRIPDAHSSISYPPYTATDTFSGLFRHLVRVAEQVVNASERAGGVCLTCRAVAESDLVIRSWAPDRLRCVAPVSATLAGRNDEEGQR